MSALPIEIEEHDPGHRQHHDAVHEAINNPTFGVRGIEMLDTLGAAAYKQITTDVTVTVAPDNVDVAGLSFEIDIDEDPAAIFFGGFVYHDTVDKNVQLRLYEGATQVGQAGAFCPDPAGSNSVFGRLRRPAGTGVKTYKINLFNFDGVGTAHLLGGVQFPAFIHAVKL